MRHILGWSVWCMLFICGWFASGLPAAETALTRQQLADFFDAGWKPSLANQKNVAVEYGRLTSAAPGDAGLENAFLVLLLKQRQYDDAVQQATKLLRTKPEDVYVLRARIWTLTLQKKYETALADCESLAAAVAKDRQPPLNVEEQQGTVEFLGRVYAFINGPANSGLTAGSREAAQRRMLDKLGAQRAVWFEQGVKTVAEKYAALGQELKTTKSATIAEEQEQKEKLKVVLAEQKVELAGEQNEIDQQLSRLRIDADKQVQQVDVQLTPLQQQLARVEAQAGAVAANVNFENNQIASWLNIADNARNQFEYDQAISQVRSHELLRSNHINQLNLLQSQVGGFRNQINRLLSQRQGILNEYQAQSNPLEKRLRDIGGQKNRIANDERKTLQPSTGVTTQTTSMSIKSQGFITYEDFPFEQERRRIEELGK